MMSAFLIIDDDEFLLLLIRAVNEARTRDPQLGKLVLYQLSYYRKLSRYRDSNPGPIHYE